VEKTFKGRRPDTMLKLTDKGREAFQTYRRQMTQFFEDVPE
jgi:DNA-binding PadR family transcriptional regulator